VRQGTDRELDDAAHQLGLLAEGHRGAVSRSQAEIGLYDSYPTQTPGASPATGTGNLAVCRCDGTGCDVCMPVTLTRVERAADARVRLGAQRDAYLARIARIKQDVAAALEEQRTLTGTRLKAAVQRCDGRHLEGSDVLWVPHSRDPDNGWYDPLCAEAADASGLSPRCRIRHDRWRREHNLPPLAHARTEAA
jgi:hypothetical protein